MKPLTRGQSALALLSIQLVLILSILGKFWYERHTNPRLWVRTGQVDPNMPIRGRYLALYLLVNACDLPRNAADFKESPTFDPDGKMIHSTSPSGFWSWDVTLHETGGQLIPTMEEKPHTPENVHHLTLFTSRPCDQVPLQDRLEYFIPDTAKTPFPLKPGEELWVEVTLPPAGPPRPIQLALSDPSGFHPLPLR